MGVISSVGVTVCVDVTEEVLEMVGVAGVADLVCVLVFVRDTVCVFVGVSVGVLAWAKTTCFGRRLSTPVTAMAMTSIAIVFRQLLTWIS